MMDVTFDDLVQDSEKLLMDVQGYTDMPYITRSLDQMRSFGDKLYLSRGPHSDVKAARLLGNKMSYELPGQLSSKLESISSSRAVDSVTASSKLDIQSFLKTERENALLNVIAMTQESLFESVADRTSRALQSWWEQEAAGVLSALAGCSGPVDTDLLHHTTSSGRDGERRGDFLGNELGGTANRTREELIYAKQVDRFLATQLPYRADFSSQSSASLRSGLLHLLAEANGIAPDTNLSSTATPTLHSELTGIWRLVQRFGEAVQQHVQQRHNQDASRAHAIELRASPQFQHRLVLCSLEHLEAEFVQFIRSTIANHPRVARLGGRPGTRELVKAYLNICLPAQAGKATTTPGYQHQQHHSMLQGQEDVEFEDGLVDSKPVWPMIYYCLRAGDSVSAIEVARAASNNLENFSGILEEYINGGRRLSSASQSRLRQNSLQILKVSRDPYKRLLFSILGLGAANDNHTDVAQSIDDFLWVKLSQVAAHLSPSSATTGHWNIMEETVTLSQLQVLLYETYGEVHFDAWSQPLIYFKLLCLTQQFEAAIGFLARLEALRSHAVHVALALHTHGLLLLTDSIQSPLVCRNETDPSGCRRLNFARLIMLYTRKFELDCPSEALMYFYFLMELPTASESTRDMGESTLGADTTLDEHGRRGLDTSTGNLFGRVTDENMRQQNSLFVTCVTELVLATKEFDLLLGSVNESNVRKLGAIDRYCRSLQERQRVIAAVAQSLEARGQLLQAINVYEIAAAVQGSDCSEYFHKVVALTNHLVASVVASTDGSTSQNVTGPLRGLTGSVDRDTVLAVATKLGRRVRRSESFARDSFFDVSAEGLSSGSTKTLFYLLDLATFFDLVQAEQWQSALDHMDQLGLLPNANSQYTQVEAKVQLFSQLPDHIRSPIPAALLASMRCFLGLMRRLHAHVTPGSPGSRLDDADSSNITLASIRNRARALITYVGRIPYKLPGDVYARLTQMHMEIM